MAALGITPGRAAAEPNVIPMIDILLVLLIIFMLQGVRQVIPVQTPPASHGPSGGHPSVVLELLASRGYAINGQSVPDSLLDRTLTEIFGAYSPRMLFVRAAPDRIYQEVVEVFDRSRGAGIEVVSLMPW